MYQINSTWNLGSLLFHRTDLTKEWQCVLIPAMRLCVTPANRNNTAVNSRFSAGSLSGTDRSYHGSGEIQEVSGSLQNAVLMNKAILNETTLFSLEETQLCRELRLSRFVPMNLSWRHSALVRVVLPYVPGWKGHGAGTGMTHEKIPWDQQSLCTNAQHHSGQPELTPSCTTLMSFQYAPHHNLLYVYDLY